MAHHTLRLTSSPYERAPDLDVSGFVPDTHDDARLAADFAGRAALTFQTGAFSLSARPTAADLRRLASVCTMLADELEQQPGATAETMRLVGAA